MFKVELKGISNEKKTTKYPVSTTKLVATKVEYVYILSGLKSLQNSLLTSSYWSVSHEGLLQDTHGATVYCFSLESSIRSTKNVEGRTYHKSSEGREKTIRKGMVS